MALHSQRRPAEAEHLYRQLQSAFPDSTDILHLLGLVEIDQGREETGFAKLHEAIRLAPQVPHYHANLGARLIDRQRAAEAESCLRQAVSLQPELASHHYNLGNALLQLKRPSEATTAYRQSLSLQAENADCELQLGIALHASDQRAAAIAWYREVVSRRPPHLAILTNLGAMLQEDCDLDGAVVCFRQALQLEPNNTVPLNNLAVIHKDLGETAEAVRLLRRCTELEPTAAAIRSNLILIMHYDPASTAADIRAQHDAWNQQHPLTPSSFPHSPDPQRRLRVGFISPDFRDHVVGRALLPSFIRHNRAVFEIFAYDVGATDEFSQHFQAGADHWRSINGLKTDQVADLVRTDQIDILVDLSLHTSDNRLEVFARKPAPIQVSWLGYPETSGLAAMDYRLSDVHLEPPGGNLLAATQEQAWLLPYCWTCYAPPEGYPAVNPLPALRGDGFVFGSLNNGCKINAEVLQVWARILKATPGSRLRLLAKPGSNRRRIRETLAGFGVAVERVLFADYIPATLNLSQGGLLKRYHDIDLALDTFPYGGMTTTLDALWMGVPVVSLVGERNLGRAGLSILSNVGLAEFATPTLDAYVALAVSLAQDHAQLAQLRAELRPRMQASPLLDAAGFTRQLEKAFRGMWLEWCQRQPRVG